MEQTFKTYRPPQKMALSNLLYTFWIWFFRLVVHIFFDRIELIGADKVPKTGATIFVGNHQNQFVDGLLLLTMCQRPISFLMAAVSMRRPVVGFLARSCHCIPVERPQDTATTGKGQIRCEELDVVGEGTDFVKQVKVGESLYVKGSETAVVDQVVDATHIKLKTPFASPFEGFQPFKIFPRVDQTEVYASVWEHLGSGQCIGIFPEGGSHDRTELLPLKAGVTLMALGAVDKYSIPVKVVPCGLNYFSGHKFRSRVAVEFGEPLEITPDSELVKLYRTDKRKACSELLDLIAKRLRSVTLNVPDYKTMQALYACRRLYQPVNVTLTVDQYLELHRRFAKGYIRFKDEPRVQEVTQLVHYYCKELQKCGLKDFQVAAAAGLADDSDDETEEDDTLMNIRFADDENHIIDAKTFYRALISNFVVFAILFVIALPGTLLNLPIGFLIKRAAERKAKEAVKGSSVKIRGTDVIASTKVLNSLVLVPIFYFLYSLAAGIYFGSIAVAVGVFFCLPFFSYLSIRVLQKGVFTWRTLLAVRTVHRSEQRLRSLRKSRRHLQRAVRQLVEELGPKLGAEIDWDHRIIKSEDIAKENVDKKFLLSLHSSYTSINDKKKKNK